MAMPYRGLHRWEQGVKDDGDNDENFKYDKQVDVYLQYWDSCEYKHKNT